MDRTVGFAGTLKMANPYEILADDVLESRGKNRNDGSRSLRRLGAVHRSGHQLFLHDADVRSTTWAGVRHSILEDPGATWRKASETLATALANRGAC